MSNHLIFDNWIIREYESPKDDKMPEKEKERMLNNWLMDLGW